MESRHLGGALLQTSLELPRAIPQKPHFTLETGWGMGYTHSHLVTHGLKIEGLPDVRAGMIWILKCHCR